MSVSISPISKLQPGRILLPRACEEVTIDQSEPLPHWEGEECSGSVENTPCKHGCDCEREWIGFCAGFIPENFCQYNIDMY